MDDFRKDKTLQEGVAQHLAQLEVEDNSSSEIVHDQEDASDNSKQAALCPTSKSLCSGKFVKPTSKVVRPQLWPHSELNVTPCSKDITYNANANKNSFEEKRTTSKKVSPLSMPYFWALPLATRRVLKPYTVPSITMNIT